MALNPFFADATAEAAVNAVTALANSGKTALVKFMRNYIRVTGGGNVQTALGRG
jgi:hypothetical protein